MEPQHGIRFELTRLDAPADEVRYGVALHGPGALWQSQATVRLTDGETRIEPFSPGDPPAWSLATLRAFLRGEWRSRRDDPEDPWPSRITRWRTERV